MWENEVNRINEFEKIREKSPENKRRSDNSRDKSRK